MKKAFTLIEILVATFIFSLTVLIAFSAFYSTTSFQSKTRILRDTTQTARNVMETITRDVRLADSIETLNSSDGPCSSSCSTLRITKGSQTKKYRVTGTQISLWIGVYEYELTDHLTVQPANTFSLTTGGTGVQIQLTVKEEQAAPKKMTEKGIITLQTTVYRRGYTQ